MGNPLKKPPVKIEKTCPACGGTGKDEQGKTCMTCNGTGRVNRH